AEINNIARAAGAKGILASDKVKKGLLAPIPVWSFDAVFARAAADAHKKPADRGGDAVASIIFTSGTTGKPKGVMLSDRNFTALTARIGAVFGLHRADSLLSVLPLHHTFEFSTGLLFPLAAGASVTYLEE